MVRTPEGIVKDKIKAELKRVGAYYFMPVQNGMGSPSLDFICCVRGWFVGIEAKAAGERPTKRQQVTMQEMRAAGAEVILVVGEEDIPFLVTTLAFMGAL